jgi:hypothetical protein
MLQVKNLKDLFVTKKNLKDLSVTNIKLKGLTNAFSLLDILHNVLRNTIYRVILVDNN